MTTVEALRWALAALAEVDRLTNGSGPARDSERMKAARAALNEAARQQSEPTLRCVNCGGDPDVRFSVPVP